MKQEWWPIFSKILDIASFKSMMLQLGGADKQYQQWMQYLCTWFSRKHTIWSSAVVNSWSSVNINFSDINDDTPPPCLPPLVRPTWLYPTIPYASKCGIQPGFWETNHGEIMVDVTHIRQKIVQVSRDTSNINTYYRKIVICYIISLGVFIKTFFNIVVTAFTQMVGKLIEIVLVWIQFTLVFNYVIIITDV